MGRRHMRSFSVRHVLHHSDTLTLHQQLFKALASYKPALAMRRALECGDAVKASTHEDFLFSYITEGFWEKPTGWQAKGRGLYAFCYLLKGIGLLRP